MEPLDWVGLFFGEQCIVQTFQLLLTQGNQTLEELHHLCVVAHESSLLFALTSEGLTPFASHREYTIPFARMNVLQLQTLRRLCKEQSEDAMKLNYGVDFYIVSTTTTERKIDDTYDFRSSVYHVSRPLLSKTQQTRIQRNSSRCRHIGVSCECSRFQNCAFMLSQRRCATKSQTAPFETSGSLIWGSFLFIAAHIV